MVSILASWDVKGGRKGTISISRSCSYLGLIILNGNGSAGNKPGAANGKRGADVACGRAEAGTGGDGEVDTVFIGAIAGFYCVGVSDLDGHNEDAAEAAEVIGFNGGWGGTNLGTGKVDSYILVIFKPGAADRYLGSGGSRDRVNAYFRLNGKLSLSFEIGIITGNGYGVVSGGALRDDNVAGKVTIAVGIIITTVYLNIVTIIFNSDIFPAIKIGAFNLDLGAYRTFIWVYIYLGTDYREVSRGKHCTGVIINSSDQMGAHRCGSRHGEGCRKGGGSKGNPLSRAIGGVYSEVYPDGGARGESRPGNGNCAAGSP
ncbi:hypothetical protein ES703_112969 [subsurface metagenome]